ncbi:hypothetical protein TcWFU_004514 [Taenia crassiceps]|uniref:Uncharacterized protein n=1 Tax=Taenia crassiceps TaxID=6207 RepID=A0ABR4QB60_9CEST
MAKTSRFKVELGMPPAFGFMGISNEAQLFASAKEHVDKGRDRGTIATPSPPPVVYPPHGVCRTSAEVYFWTSELRPEVNSRGGQYFAFLYPIVRGIAEADERCRGQILPLSTTAIARPVKLP